MIQTAQLSDRANPANHANPPGNSPSPAIVALPAVTSVAPAAKPPADRPTDLVAANWVNRFFSTRAPIPRQDISEIVYFHFLSDLFERLVCEKVASLGKLEEVVQQFLQQGKLASVNYQQCLSAYRKRYLDKDGRVGWRLREIYFHSWEESSLVRSVLENRGTQDIARTLVALLLLTYRYRNSLLHTKADWSLLPSRVAVLESASQLLMQFLDCWQDCVIERQTSRTY